MNTMQLSSKACQLNKLNMIFFPCKMLQQKYKGFQVFVQKEVTAEILALAICSIFEVNLLNIEMTIFEICLC